MHRRIPATPAPLAIALLAAALLGLGCGCSGGVAGPAEDVTAEALLAEAWEAVEFANWLGAVRRFEWARERSGADDPERATAVFGLAYCWQNRAREADLERAKRLYKEVIDEHPTARVAPHAMMALARIHDMPIVEGDRDIERACGFYRRLRQEFPDHVLADEATLWLGSHEITKAQDDPAAEAAAIGEYYLAWLERRPENAYAPAMYNIIARTYSRRARRADSAARRRTESDERTELVGRAADYWRRTLEYSDRALAADAATEVRLLTDQDLLGISKRAARIAELRLADHAVALRWYRMIAEELPDNSWRMAARQGMDRCLAALDAEGDDDDG